jgi:Zn-dependent M28 family amino/carboxypeptidase
MSICKYIIFLTKGHKMVNINNLKNTVKVLTTIKPARSYNNLESLNKIAKYIQTQFESYGLENEIQPYNVGENEYKNIIGTINPQGKETIVIGAHYDVCGELPGADDNASAIAGLLELARILKLNEKSLNTKIIFVAYSLEEPPYFGTKEMGSYIHAKSLKDSNIDIKVMICLEMIGYFSDEENSQEYPLDFMKDTYPNTGNFIAIAGTPDSAEAIEGVMNGMKKTTLPAEKVIAPREVPGISLSDHRNYWTMDYKALMITDTAFFRNPNYHKSSDTMDTLDFEKMAEVVKGVYYYVTKSL